MEDKRRADEMIKKRLNFYSKSATDYRKEAGKPRKLGKLRKLHELEHALKPVKTTQMDYMKSEYKKKMKKLTPSERAIAEPIKLVRDGVKLAMMMTGTNMTDFDEKNLRMISPRVMSLVPEDSNSTTNEVNLLSPSLFSLHSNGSGIEKMTSLTNLLNSTGLLKERDQQDWLDFIIETSGAGEAIEEAKLVYGSSSPYNNSAALEDMRNVTDEDAHRTVRDTVRDVAAGRLRYEAKRGLVKLVPVQSRRLKRAIVLSPLSNVILVNDPVTVSQPLILSPVILSALINSPAIFGVVVLSPWLFIPVVLSPRIFSPVVLSPFMFVPVILTPLAFVPVILSPGIMNPFVLSPLVFSPFILSPQVMTPLILSPFALNPFIGTPNVLSPLILSPFVLSPLIFSPAYVSALVLSPYALSPAFQSTGAIFTSIASPSWLS
ncbi:hypothetical protein OESDEN_15427 [Oesophagostomum dentatum]|uniref:Uncharacterized protein n=1 Tax=Oesophagostomum dentatum TaxID=61180 RepID=A0A0B1SIV5_OESDE|nr:hypothetical protein OESDEN_15427 [Oesophagostomum dentatum]